MTNDDRFQRLIVMRHAKSSWESEAGTDHERPLNERGRRDAPRIADRLVQLGWVPDRVCTSDSRRTLETWSRMADRMPTDVPVVSTRRLYHASVESFVDVVGEVQADDRCVLALGHNPGWEEVVRWLAGQAVSLTTANAVLLRSDRSRWAAALAPDAWGLVDVLRPREL